MDRHWDYMYREHSAAEVRRWARHLHHLRYCRAYGGHANDVDRFAVTFPTADRPTLLAVFAALGLEPRKLTPDAKIVEEGRKYSGAEAGQLHWPIDIAPDLEVPDDPRIEGVRVSIIVGRGELDLSIFPQSDDQWSLTEADFELATRVDAFLATRALATIDPPQDDDHCFCPKHHPDLWRDA